MRLLTDQSEKPVGLLEDRSIFRPAESVEIVHGRPMFINDRDILIWAAAFPPSGIKGIFTNISAE